jgi:hypothetical protein
MRHPRFKKILPYYFNGLRYPRPIPNPLILPENTPQRTGIILSMHPERDAKQAELQAKITEFDNVDRARTEQLATDALEHPTIYSPLSGKDRPPIIFREKEAKSLHQPVKRHFYYIKSKSKRWSTK